MPPKRKKHQYFITGGKIPRRSEYRMRLARDAREARLWLNRNGQKDKESACSSGDESLNSSEAFVSLSEISSCQSNSSESAAPTLCADEQYSSSSGDELSNSVTFTSTEHAYSQYSEFVSNESGVEGIDPLVDDSNFSHLTANEEDNENYETQASGDEDDVMRETEADFRARYEQDEMPNFSKESSSNNRENNISSLSNKLCCCSSTTEGDALLYCLALGIRHNLSWVAMVDILKMVNKLYGYEAVSASKYYLQKLFDRQNTATYHMYCSVCETYLGVKDDTKEQTACECSPDETADCTTSFFLSVDLGDQFKTLMQREEVGNEILTYRFERKKLNEDAYEDIFDGEAYKNAFRDGELLSNPYNFSYTFNTDGVQLGKSTRNAAWPIFISVNELKPQNRKKHMIFGGIWVGKKQPNMRIFLKPFVDEVNRLSEEGFYWTDSNGNHHRSRVFPLCCVVDSPARYKLLNLISYTGYFGCTFCYQKAENTKKGRRFTILKKPATLRTHRSMLQDMKEAFELRNDPDKKKRTVRGCKGYTPLALMKHLALDTAFIVDSMHNSFLGVAKTHTGNLLTICRTKFYIGSPDQISIVCQRLSSIYPPSTITRSPRSIEEWKMWKASEWRSWQLFYVLVCLHGLIPQMYIEHLALFSAALYLLLQKSMTYADIQLANELLPYYGRAIKEQMGIWGVVE